MSGIPVTLVESGGFPVTQVEHGARPVRVVTSGGIPVTLVASGGLPLVLLDSAPAPTPTPTPTPAPSFTVQPSISHDGTPQVGETLTGNDGTITNGTVSARQWLLNGSAISGATGATYVPDTAGNIGYRVTATGAGGSTQATSSAVTVAAAPTPTPTPTPTPSFAVLIDGSPAPEETLIDTVTTDTGVWPLYYLGASGDLRFYRWALNSDPAWFSIMVARLPDPTLLSSSHRFTETLVNISVDGAAQDVRVLQGSLKFYDSGVPVAASMARVNAAVAAQLLYPVDSTAFTKFPTAKTLEASRSAINAIGYRPDRIYGKQVTSDNAIGNVSSGTGEDHSSRGFMSEADNRLVAAAIAGNSAVFDELAERLRVECMYGLALPHFVPWSATHHTIRDPQVPFSGEQIFASEGSAPSGGIAINTSARWEAPAGYPYLAEINATAGTAYSQTRDTAHLFNHGWALWHATGDPRIALLQQSIAAIGLGGVGGPRVAGQYINRFNFQRISLNMFTAAWKLAKLNVTSTNDVVFWNQTRRTFAYDSHYGQWQSRLATMDASAVQADIVRREFKCIDANDVFSDFMNQQYGCHVAYLMAKDGKPDLLKRLAENMIIRVSSIGGARGMDNDPAYPNNGANGSNLFSSSAVTATTLAGIIAEVFDPRTGLSNTTFDTAQSALLANAYLLLKNAQDAVSRGWCPAISGLDAAVTTFDSQLTATTNIVYQNLMEWRHCGKVFP